MQMQIYDEDGDLVASRDSADLEFLGMTDEETDPYELLEITQEEY